MLLKRLVRVDMSAALTMAIEWLEINLRLSSISESFYYYNSYDIDTRVSCAFSNYILIEPGAWITE